MTRSSEQQLIDDQREANAAMVQATLQAQDATEQAEQSEERYRTLFDLSPVAVYSCDVAGVIQKFNRNAADLWGRAPSVGDADERFCGSHKLFRPDGTFMPHHECHMADVLSGKIQEVRDAEVLIERPDGSRRTVVVNIRPLKNQHGEVTAAINCFYDITGRKRTEVQQAEALDRERELAAFRESFIGIVGHDLRTPLSSILLGASVLLQRGNLDAKNDRAVGRIISSSQRMARMITQLLDLTRARLGVGFTLEPKPTDLRELCRTVVDELEVRDQLEPVGLELEGDVTGDWDQDRLHQVLSNLAGNAIEYATPGTAVVLKAHDEGATVVIEVSNQGAPIPPDELPIIFEPFRRGRQQKKSENGNLGLGLYIARQLVLAHGGTLDAQSTAGNTTFTIRLPRHVS